MQIKQHPEVEVEVEVEVVKQKTNRKKRIQSQFLKQESLTFQSRLSLSLSLSLYLSVLVIMRETGNRPKRGERLFISITSYNDRDPVMLTHKHTKGQTDTEHRFSSVTVIFGLSTVMHNDCPRGT